MKKYLFIFLIFICLHVHVTQGLSGDSIDLTIVTPQEGSIIEVGKSEARKIPFCVRCDRLNAFFEWSNEGPGKIVTDNTLPGIIYSPPETIRNENKTSVSITVRVFDQEKMEIGKKTLHYELIETPEPDFAVFSEVKNKDGMVQYPTYTVRWGEKIKIRLFVPGFEIIEASSLYKGASVKMIDGSTIEYGLPRNRSSKKKRDIVSVIFKSRKNKKIRPMYQIFVEPVR